jgi:thiol-disulfide isomerase/thioredoxin
MKKLLLINFALLLAVSSYAQQLFFEDFNDGIPETFTLTDVDGLTPANTNLSVGSFFARTLTGQECAASYSWFNPVGVADDWMATPSITIPESDAPISLQFDALGFEAAFPDGVEVYISTTGATPADFMDDPIYSTTDTGEPEIWTTRALDISSYKGQDIYVAFRNNSNDQNILGIDNIIIKELADNDASLANISIDNVTEGDRSIDVVIKNVGGNAITSFDLDWEFDGTSDTENISGINLATGETNTIQLDLGDLTIGSYDFSAEVNNVNGTTDPEMADNSASETYNIVPGILDFTLTDSYGTEWNMYDELTAGKIVILDFFASWCGPCEDSTPELNTMYLDNSDQVNVFGITIESNDDDNVINNLGWGGTYPKFSYTQSGEEQYAHYGLSRGFNTGGSIPFFVMICPNPSDPKNSEVVQTNTGFGPGMFTTNYEPKINQCPGVISGVEENTISDYKVFPNPITTTVNIQLSVKESTVTTINIIDMLGKTLKTSSHSLYTGNNTVTFDVNDLANGIYLVQTNVNGNSNTQKITVAK